MANESINNSILLLMINNNDFKPFPLLPDIYFKVLPDCAKADLDKLGSVLITNQETASTFLQVLIDRGRKIGLQIFIYIENPEYILPEEHRLTTAILSCQNEDNIYFTPSTGVKYSTDSLKSIFA